MQLRNKRNISNTWVEVSEKALVDNLNSFRRIVGERTKVLSVVKANAYGHGLKEAVAILDKGKTDWFGVDNMSEALEIRSLGIEKPVLLLGYIEPRNLKQAVDKNISLTVYDNEIIRKIVSLRLKKKARIHLKIETGLNRQGVKRGEILRLASLIQSHKKQLILEGVSTHFANIEDTLDPSFALSQLGSFKKTIRALSHKLENVPLCHCAASAAVLLYPETHFSLVRIGIGLYGLWPSKETQIAFSLRRKKAMELKPVLTWKSTVAQVKELDTGESVGYGRTWFAPKESKIAIVSAGYFDGYDRKLSNQGRVLVKGKFAPLVGRVAMNMIMVDVSEIPGVKAKDTVVLIGRSRNKFLSAEELAEKIGTINYEVVSRINPLLPRVVI